LTARVQPPSMSDTDLLGVVLAAVAVLMFLTGFVLVMS
jgi:hypothetical protein